VQTPPSVFILPSLDRLALRLRGSNFYGYFGLLPLGDLQQPKGLAELLEADLDRDAMRLERLEPGAPFTTMPNDAEATSMPLRTASRARVGDQLVPYPLFALRSLDGRLFTEARRRETV
jgi:hypothetical protein